eukprot:XP_019928946.1 PREDICTED: uncharacterized protein LOC105343393 isoform X2 [Crassostrea gigas]
MMWFRICLLLTVALTLVNAHGTYRLVHPALVPGWLDRFPNSRILLNRDYYNYLYRRLILRDPYWRSRIHLHRHIYPAVIRSQRVNINPVLLRRNVRVVAPQVQQTSVVGIPPPIPQDNRHLIGKAETFIRYTSPSLDKYNTPWQKISSSYRDYGEATSPALYDRPFYGGGSIPSGYDDQEIFPDSDYGYGLQESAYLGGGGLGGGEFGGSLGIGGAGLGEFGGSLGLSGGGLGLTAGASNYEYVQPRQTF